MPVRSIFYSGTTGRDIHLVWGDTSQDLTIASLAVADTDGTLAFAKTYFAAHADVQLEFRPVFKGAVAGANFEGFGIRVETATGKVSFTQASPPVPPADARSNFILEAVVKNAAGDLPDVQPAIIRVHVHPALRRMWLTPSLMTVRRATAAGEFQTKSRFTVRAEFTDDVVGDITEHHNVIWSPLANVNKPAGSDAGRLKIDAANTTGQTVDITATWKAQNATGKMRIAQPWSTDPAMPRAELVDGHPDTWAGTIKPEVVPNVLVFGDGFTTPDLAALTDIANAIVHDLKTDSMTRPYDRLATAMNYWSVAVPAPARGISVQCEMFTFDDGGTTFALPVLPAIAPRAGQKWTVPNLNYMAGLPMPRDAAGQKTAAALRTEWGRTMRATPALDVDDAVIEEWQKAATRTFIDEIDGFPAMALGRAPRASDPYITPLLQLHPDRTGDVGLLPFYQALRAKNGVAVEGGPGATALGNVWAEMGYELTVRGADVSANVKLPAVQADANYSLTLRVKETTGTPPALAKEVANVAKTATDFTVTLKAAPGAGNSVTFDWLLQCNDKVRFENRSLVVMMAGVRAGRAQRISENPPHIAMSLEGGNFRMSVTAIAGRRAFALSFADPMPNSVNRSVWRVIAHELGHSFGLGDEYSELPGVYNKPESALDRFGNLTTLAAAQVANAFNSRLVKWNWHRARKGAVLAGAVTVAGGNIEVPLVDNAGLQFVAGDKVLLRQRQWKKVIGASPVVSQTLQVVSHDALGTKVTLAGAGGFDPAPFAAGSLLLLPLVDPADATKFLNLIAPKVAAHIDSQNRPLSKWPCDPADHIGKDANGVDRGSTTTVPEYDGYDGIWSHRNDSKTIGLYSGGALQGCGIFHPAGQCMMRNANLTTNEFCHACRYVLVDTIDPRAHWWIDRDYDSIYPT